MESREEAFYKTLGPFQKYVEMDEITDIDYNGRALWIKDIYGVKRRVEDAELTEQFIANFVQNIANNASLPFNKQEDILEAETKNLRLTCVHDSVAVSGTAICIRKTTSTPRMSYEKVIQEEYAPEAILNLLINCMRVGMNFIICGAPGVGKTEFAKFLCNYIPKEEKVITIEDNPEWHYKDFRPEADCIELRVNEWCDYSKALKTCMRLNPDRIMLSEVRSTEAVHLIECWTTGMKGITTLHADDVRKIPNRLTNMMDIIDAARLENNIYDCLDVGILIRSREGKEGRRFRYLDQVAFFERKDKQNVCIPILENGLDLVDAGSSGGFKIKIPYSKSMMLSRAGIRDPYKLEEEKHETKK